MIKSLFSYLFPRKAYGDVVAPLRLIISELDALQGRNNREIQTHLHKILQLKCIVEAREQERDQASHTQQKIEALLD